MRALRARRDIHRRMLAVASYCYIAACGGAASQIQIGPPPPAGTSGVLAGGLCSGDHCTCAHGPADGGAGVPGDADHKRFEFQLTSPQAIWATVGQTRLYKSAERAVACFFVDLPAGQTQVELRASAPSGAAGAWRVRELGTATKSYYDTFAFNCGVPGVCAFDALETAKAEYAEAGNHRFDQCGSTKIKQLSWATGRAPDQEHPSELLVRFQLDVHKFAPWLPHGDSSCGKGRPPAADRGADSGSAAAPAP